MALRDRLPDFLPTNDTDSNLYKYTKAHDNELTEYIDDIERLKTELYLEGRTWEEWQSDIQYDRRDQVSYRGLNYRAISDDRGDIPLGSLPRPSSVETTWNPDADVQTDITISWDDVDWDDFVWDDEDESLLSGYDRGEEVVHEGASYRALSDIIVIEPNSVTTEWQSGETYDAGRYVTHEGVSYRARIQTSDEPQPVLHGDWKPIWKGLWRRFDDKNLDRVGALFGEIGRRTGRNDVNYRQYLSSLVEVFRGRGERKSIRKVIGSAIVLPTVDDDELLSTDEIDEELLTEDTDRQLATAAQKVEVTENFEELEYDLRIEDWQLHSLSALVQIADIADPSGVRLAGIAYDAGPLEPDLSDDYGDHVTHDLSVDSGYGSIYGSVYSSGESTGETVSLADDTARPTVTEYDSATLSDTRISDVTDTQSDIADTIDEYLAEITQFISDQSTITEVTRVTVDDGVQPATAGVESLTSDVQDTYTEPTILEDERETEIVESVTDTAGAIDDITGLLLANPVDSAVLTDTRLSDVTADGTVDSSVGGDDTFAEITELPTDTSNSADAVTDDTVASVSDTSVGSDDSSADVTATLEQKNGYGTSYGASYGSGEETGDSKMGAQDTVNVTVTDL